MIPDCRPNRRRDSTEPFWREAVRCSGGALLAALMVMGCSEQGGGSSRLADGPSEGCPGVAGETIRWIVPFSPGGGYDVYSRLLEPFYEEAIGAEIVIQNRVGAGGRIGARAVRDSEPDGTTLRLVNAFALLVGEMTGETSGLDPLAGFTVLGRLSPPFRCG